MRRIVSILAVLTCVFSLTACGATTSTIEGEALNDVMESTMITYGEQDLATVQQLVAQNDPTAYEDDAVYSAAVQSWENALRDIGEFNGDYQNEYAVLSDKTEISVNIGIKGSDHEANVIAVYTVDTANNRIMLSSMTTNVKYSFAELMQQAALNTVLGMGTTFIVLILLAALIYLFRYIPGLLAGSKKEEAAPAPKAAPVAAASAAAPAASVDNDVLVAIQAAITAYERSEK